MLELKLRPLAELDLEEIWLDTYVSWSEEQANYYITEIHAAFNRIQREPLLLGRKCEFNGLDYFRYNVQSHAIFYRMISSNTIHVIRILHQKMDLPEHL